MGNRRVEIITTKRRDIRMIKEKVLEFLRKNPEGGRMEDGTRVSITRFNYRDNYYNRRDIFDELDDEDLMDRVEFPSTYLFNLALEKYFDRSIDADELREDLEEIIDKARQEYKEPVNYENKDEVKRALKELYDNEDIDHNEIMDIIDPDGESIYEALDSLEYYNTVYEPEDEDVDSAIECNLVPFYLNSTFFLAFGGSGMDLSPRLDAYQALARHSIPEGSKLIRDPEYAKYVLGDKVYKEALKRAKRGNLLIEMTLEIEEEEI